MTRRRHWAALGAAGLVASLAVAAGIVVTTSTGKTDQAPAAATAQAERTTITATVNGKGAIAAAGTASAGFVDGGRVNSISVAVGQTVVVGQELATVDPGPADLALEKANGALTAAQSSLDAARQTAQAGVDSLAAAKVMLASLAADAPERQSAEATIRDLNAQAPMQRDAVAQAEKARDDARRDVTAAQTARDQTTLLAPIAGVVTAVNGTVGTIISGGPSSSANVDGSNPASAAAAAGLVSISDVSSLRVTASIPEADIASVVVGQTATATLPVKGAEPIGGTVLSVAPTPQSSTDGVVTYAVAVQLAATPPGVRLGQTAVVAIAVATAENATVVPAEAVQLTSATTGTVEVRGASGKAKTVDVTVGITTPTQVQIVAGLDPGDLVQFPTSTAQPATGDGPDDQMSGGGDGSFGGPQ
jgi:macrolide-specific efflux system membrane fusion protein